MNWFGMAMEDDIKPRIRLANPQRMGVDRDAAHAGHYAGPANSSPTALAGNRPETAAATLNRS